MFVPRDSEWVRCADSVHANALALTSSHNPYCTNYCKDQTSLYHRCVFVSAPPLGPSTLPEREGESGAIAGPGMALPWDGLLGMETARVYCRMKDCQMGNYRSGWRLSGC